MKPKKLIRAKMTDLFANNEIEIVKDKDELNKLYSLKIQEELQEIQNSNYKDIAEFGDLISVTMSFAVANDFEPQEILKQIKDKDAAKGLYYNIALTNLNPSNLSNDLYFCQNKKLFIVTNVEAGWSCIRGVFKANNEKEVYQHLAADEQERTMEEIERTYVVHEQSQITEL
jgi:predicted house-cleaning noncanonical NTP pyrophosphatase (MazG superfamily)